MDAKEVTNGSLAFLGGLVGFRIFPLCSLCSLWLKISNTMARYMNLWPAFARHFGMEPGPVRTVRLAEIMPPKAPVWDRLVKKHGLKATPCQQAVIWSYGDFVFSPEYDIMSDTTKARQHGFHEALDTERMFLDLFDYYRQEKAIP